MRVKKIIWTKFNLFDGKDNFRWTDCACNPQFWKDRAEVIRKYTGPSLHNLSDQNFDWFCPFLHDTVKYTYDCIDTVIQHGGKVVYNDYEDMRQAYARDHDYIIQLWMDSDDMYIDNIWEHIEKIKPEPGLILQFQRGYMLDDATGNLYRFGGTDRYPAFYAYYYPREWLQSVGCLMWYKRKFGMSEIHYKHANVPNVRIMPPGLFCATMSSQNVSKRLDNKNTLKYLGPRIKDKKKALDYLQRFGISI